ncbi:MAG: helix-turn-helix domain-containing protein [Clostridia bacterium]|nr:helix-turn-helix domain-containing protein [Clostridia bacterium]
MSLLNNTIVHLLNFEKYSNFQQALKEAAISNGFQVILLSEDFNPLILVETRHEKTIDEILFRSKQAGLGYSDSYRFLDVDGIKTYWGTVEINKSKYYLSIVDNDDRYDVEEITRLAELIELSMGMWRFTPEHDARAEFVKALIRGNKSLAYTIRDEIGLKDDDIVSVFCAKNITEEEGQVILDKYVEKGLFEIIKISEDNEKYGVILKGKKLKSTDNEKDMALRFFDEIKGNKQVRIFHVTGVEGVESAADAFRLISETSFFVESVFPFKRVFTKYELVMISNCISIQIQGGLLRKNYSELLEPFKRDKDNKSKQLLETLETFVLDAGMNANKTSDILGIHANTVQYRLKKINDILGVEITGNRVIPGLTLALALRRLENKVN